MNGMQRLANLIACLCLALFTGAEAHAAVCATPGRDSLGISITGVVNTYWGSTASVAAGATSITVGSSSGASATVVSGDLLLVIQMQDAQINYTNSDSYGDGVSGGLAAGASSMGQTGVYEFVRATSSLSGSGGAVSIASMSGGGLANAYSHADATLSRGQRRFQVIRVPQYSNASLGLGLTAQAWDGARGGVLAIDVAARLDLNGHTADVTGLGFRGGGGRKLTGQLGLSTTDYVSAALLSGANGSKGEGVAGTPTFVLSLLGLLDLGLETLPGGSLGRGAPGNAGGGANDGAPLTNSKNSGGGGGAGYGAGGGGGNAYCAASSGCPAIGGFGGGGVSMTAAKLSLGGGGGAGSSRNGSGALSNGLSSSGAPGGGLVIIRAGVIAGTGSIIANGAAASSSVVNDGSGGGGGGGGILIFGRQLEAGALLSASARGGAGGSNSGGGTGYYGPGGGGGGGFIQSAVSTLTDVSGGANGVTLSAASFGAASGAAGSATAGLGVSLNLTGLFSGYDCTPVLDKVFETAKITLGLKTRLKITLTNHNASASLTGAAFIDTYPTGMVNAPVPNVSTTCGGTVVAVAGTNTLQVIGASVLASASCQVAVDVAPNSIGSFVNSISAGNLTATLTDVVVTTLFPASDTVTVVKPLTAAKTATTISDPKDNTTNPKAIPGAVVEYAITIANPSTDPVSGVVVSDPIPANASLIVSDLGAAGSGPVSFTQGAISSGLTYSYTSLASTTDLLDFSNDNGATWTYAPTAGANGTDATVTHVRIRLSGSQAAAGSFTVRFRVRLK